MKGQRDYAWGLKVAERKGRAEVLTEVEKADAIQRLQQRLQQPITPVGELMKLAELEQELGLDSTWDDGDKFARIAALEGQSVDALNERYATLQNVKEAGLSKPKARKSASRLPSITAAISNGNGTTHEASTDFGDDILFMGR